MSLLVACESSMITRGGAERYIITQALVHLQVTRVIFSGRDIHYANDFLTRHSSIKPSAFLTQKIQACFFLTRFSNFCFCVVCRWIRSRTWVIFIRTRKACSFNARGDNLGFPCNWAPLQYFLFGFASVEGIVLHFRLIKLIGGPEWTAR